MREAERREGEEVMVAIIQCVTDDTITVDLSASLETVYLAPEETLTFQHTCIYVIWPVTSALACQHTLVYGVQCNMVPSYDLQSGAYSLCSVPYGAIYSLMLTPCVHVQYGAIYSLVHTPCVHVASGSSYKRSGS